MSGMWAEARIIALVLWIAALLTVGSGCTDDLFDDGDADVGADADAGGPEPGEKGGACLVDDDCVEEGAVCRQGNVCSGPIDELAFVTECDTGESDLCAGLLCIGFQPNAQGKTGICSMPCEVDPDCGEGNVCVPLAGRSVCLHVCETAADCANGFACVPDPGGVGAACLVEPSTE